MTPAGEVTAKRLLADVEADEVVRVVGSNVVGSLLGTQQAIRLMREQPAAEQPAYHIFNFGFSAFGAKVGVRFRCTSMRGAILSLNPPGASCRPLNRFKRCSSHLQAVPFPPPRSSPSLP